MSAKSSKLGSARRKLLEQAPLFAALGDETRLALVAKLSEGTPRSIAELSSGASVTRQAITKHLRVLEGAGLVHGVRQGRETQFELVTAPLTEAQDALRGISEQWDDALARLKAFVEK